MSHVVAFGIGVLLALAGLLALERWAEARTRAFHTPPVGDFS